MATEARRTCSAFGCKGAIVAKFMCDMHYRRVRDHGHAGPTTPDRGERAKHPLYSTWKGVMRAYRRECVPEWRDFWRFVGDVKVGPPQKRARFRREDDTKPFGPGNWFWLEVWRSEGDLKARADYMREYQRRLRVANPDYFLERDLRKSFGITVADYHAMHDRQGGVCAICRQPETMRINKRVCRLAIDHCHDTGKVRGLLCSKCNQGIGCFYHDASRLLAAVEYLKGT